MDDVILGSVAPASGDPAATERANGALLDRFSLALRAGDWTALGSELSGAHALAIRLDPAAGGTLIHTAEGGGASVAELRSVFGDARDLTLLVRVATDWYVFAEYLVALASGGTRRLAIIHPVEDGRLIGSFGYGRDEA